MTYAHRVIVGNSVIQNTLADYIICLSNDIGCLPPDTNVRNLTDLQVPGSIFLAGTEYSVVGTATLTGLDLHTKRRLQSESVWNSGTQLIQSELDQATDCLGSALELSTFKFLLKDKLSWGLAQAVLPGCKMYLPMFPGRPYLDLIPLVISRYDLAPVNENMSVAVFDAEVNRNIEKDYNIIYFDQTDNYVRHLAEIIKQRQRVHGLDVDQVYQGIYQAPWFVVKQMLSDTRVNVYKLVDRNYLHVFQQLGQDIDFYMHKVQEQINKFQDNQDIVVFDLGMVYTMPVDQGVDCYTKTCEQLGISPNISKFLELRSSITADRQLSTGSIPVPDAYSDIFTGIAQVILNRHSVFSDTALRDIGWNIGCDIAVKSAFKQLGYCIPDDLIAETIQDIINSAIAI